MKLSKGWIQLSLIFVEERTDFGQLNIIAPNELLSSIIFFYANDNAGIKQSASSYIDENFVTTFNRGRSDGKQQNIYGII